MFWSVIEKEFGKFICILSAYNVQKFDLLERVSFEFLFEAVCMLVIVFDKIP